MWGSSRMHSLPVYHVDSETRINRYIQGTEFLDSTEAGDWLGAGMYFWDNIANSKYWWNIKTRNNPTVNYQVVKVQQTFSDEELLDLTDRDILARTIQFADLLAKKGKGHRNDVTKHMGALLNALYEVTSESPELFGFSFSVIKGTGLYRKSDLRGNDYGLIDTTLSTSPHLTHFMKTIYLFKNDNHEDPKSKMVQDI